MVSGKYTESGGPLLANDPHLSQALPHPMYMIGMYLRDGSYKNFGFSIMGQPYIVGGQTEHIGTGYINPRMDRTDIYYEKLNEDNT